MRNNYKHKWVVGLEINIKNIKNTPENLNQNF